MAGYVLGAVVAACTLAACAQHVNDPSSATSVGSGTSAEKAAIAAQLPAARVIVQFKQTVAFQSPELLQRLQDHTQSQVGYIASVSNETHVYRFQPMPGQTLEHILLNLKAMPEVVRVELDKKIKPQN